ncbi:hypothetical protein [Clostridium gasigenes]|uniref:Uncharacterized protein n=1 Tax=Clostridium gasigenes TaxID=94869 RepID=A0A1H0PU83_9CLOT|nr:hypothetical protein [Clostridium gasigenes]MBU3088219.1 hypothetical protein [Clostridium gasigenes]SDP08370.1 hypothetical protein SAMN04488529_10267 [Clostridium gasigenes]
MKINQKKLSIVVIGCSLITLSLAVLAFFDKKYMDIMMISLGIIQVLGGISQINMSKQINSKGIIKGSKKVGIFVISIGVLIIGMVIIKVII